MAATTYYGNAILNATLRQVSYSFPAACYVALFTTPTTDAGGGTEISGNGYARVLVNSSNLAAASAKSITNSTTVTFPTATGNQGTATHVAVFDASSGGNMLFHDALSSSVSIETGDVAQFAASTLVFTT